MSSLQSLDRALDILNFIYENNGKLSASNISNFMNLHRSTVHRTLNTLCDKNFLSKDIKTNLYSIGPRMLAMGFCAANNLGISSITRPYMAFISEKYSVSTSLSIIESNNVFVISHFSGYYTTTFYSLYDDPLNCDAYRPAIAHCMLAFNYDLDLNVHAIDTYFLKMYNNKLKYNFFSNSNDFIEHLKQIKINGYTCEFGDFYPDEICYCVPIYDNTKVIATLSINAHKSHLSNLSKEDIITDLLDISSNISNIVKESKSN